MAPGDANRNAGKGLDVACGRNGGWGWVIGGCLVLETQIAPIHADCLCDNPLNLRLN
jgi:hypothetical protein